MPNFPWLQPSGALGLLRGRARELVFLTALFKVLEVLLFFPVGAAILRYCLMRWGRVSVGNFEIATFFLSIPGLIALVVISTLALACFFLEIAGLTILLANRHLRWRDPLTMLARNMVPVAKLALRQFLILLVLAAPFLLASWGIISLLWAGRDINGLLVLKPPIFWFGVAGAGTLLGIYLIIALRLMIRWSLAFPAMLFEGESSPSAAMRLSSGRTRGKFGTMARDVVTWFVLMTILTVIVMGGIALLSRFLLNSIKVSLAVVLVVTGTLLAVHGLAALVLTAIGNAALAGIVLTWYRDAGGAAEFERFSVQRLDTAPRTSAGWRTVWLVAAAAIVVAVISHFLLNTVRVTDTVEITAHRAGGALGPENSVAALRKSIEARAEWAEIDVQHTADKALVITHDSDLVRIGGPNRQVADVTLAEVKNIDLGDKFGAEFQGERVPVLEEIIAAANDKIRLNIELKPHGEADVEPLVRGVVDVLRRTGIVQRCRVCSQSYDGIQLARRLEPDLAIGFIAGAAIGDVSKLDVNYLMLNSKMATRRLCDSARARGIDIHPWTINDVDMLAPLLDRGAANVITDDPGSMRSRLEEIQQLNPAERLLLRARNLLAD